MRNLVYSIYEARLERQLDKANIPKHIAVMLDGNRRWADKNNGSKAKSGHVAGAQKIFEFLSWCDELEVPVITLYLLSTENLKQRNTEELQDLFQILDQLAKEMVSRGRWKIRIMGDKSALAGRFLDSLEESEKASQNTKGATVNLSKVSESLTPELIASHLYTSDQPDPDLIIRTSGEQRLSGFLLWQSSNSELYFEEALWPDFRKVDFLRAIRAFARRHRRFGA